MTTHRVLWVDDRFEEVHDHVAALRQAGHRVDHAPNLQQARALLLAEFAHQLAQNTSAATSAGHSAPAVAAGAPTPSAPNGFSMVFIDLMVGGAIPSDLQSACKGLAVGRLNDGQALGQWLWQRRCNGEPTTPYAYFSNIPESFQSHSDAARQEFLFSTGDARSSLVLEKFNVFPSGMPKCLADCLIAWGRP